ncbi:MAG TPA: ABC transporter ATP-binding protein [Actinomycetota bacterium]|jgi:lipopolysaccharide transport system ATP-binding protein|nr:ABC transporter ATP-binding protein [Actinomycetota bacterium]
MTPAIDVDDIWKRYRLGKSAAGYGTVKEAFSSFVTRIGRARAEPAEDFWALKGVSFQVGAGEAIGIIGRNGAGKSTILKILSRITLPTRGRASLRGRVGALLEVGTGFNPELTGRENVFLNGAILGMGRNELREKFDEIVAFSEIGTFIDTPVKRYSSGMQMRLAFSVAAHLEPDVMLVDEVLAVGDEEFQNKCFGKIGEIEREGRTVVFISHNLGAVRRLCKRCILLDEGRVVADGPTDSVLQTYYDLIGGGEATAASEEHGRGGTRLLGWEVRSDDRRASVVRSGEPCEITFRLASTVDHHQIFLVMAIYSQDGILVSSLRTLETLGGFSSLDPGKYSVTFRLPTFPVAPGLYDVHLTLHGRHEGQISSWHVQPPLRVTSEGAPAEDGKREGGVLWLPGEASVERV